MSLCIIDGKQCQCQPDEGRFCEKACERLADLELAAKENARYSTEMREEFERRGERIAELDAALAEAVGLFNAQKQMYEKAHARYEKLRRLNPREFHSLWMQNIALGEPFDDLVDRLPS